MLRLMLFVPLFVMTSAINGAYKGGMPPKLANERAERLSACEDRVLLMYARECEKREQSERDYQAIIKTHQQSLFDNDSTKADAFKLMKEKIDALMAQQLLENRNLYLEQCRTRNPL